MYEISKKNLADEQYKTMMTHKNAYRLLLHFLTRDFKVSDPSQDIKGEIELEDMIELLNNVCHCLSNIAVDDYSCKQMLNEYDLIAITKSLLNKYFKTNFLKIQEVVIAKDLVKITSRVKLLTNMMWFLNNLNHHMLDRVKTFED